MLRFIGAIMPKLLRALIRSPMRIRAAIFEWKNELLRDIALTMAEAVFILIISYIPFIPLTVDYFVSNAGASFDSNTMTAVAKTLIRPGEVLVYIAGILGSTTAYFIVKMLFSPPRRAEYFVCIIIPLFLIILATPVFMADRYSKIVNMGFVVQYGGVLSIATVCIWIYSLLVQRRPFPVALSGDSPSDKQGCSVLLVWS